MLNSVYQKIIKELIKSGAKTAEDLAMIKRKIAKKYKIACPSNIVLLKTYHKMVKNKSLKRSLILENLLRTRPIRSLSGIVNISVLTKPYPCPGKCIYCPNQKGIPKSYLKNEPAVMRAILNKYDPYKQIKMRFRALEAAGHPTDKIELRIIGGTWSYYPKRYQTWFIKRCFDACNQNNYAYGQSLLTSQKLNEKAKHRIVGLSVETRPDFINEKEIKRFRKLGVTMVELGVQSIYDDVLELNKRGHVVETTIRATKLLKDTGFKVCYHIMLNLPGSTLSRDLKMFKILFSDSRFQPDLLKIYPCALLKETLLYKWWREKKYNPYSDGQLINLLKAIKKIVPFYVRIQRITRDIPSSSIVAGPSKISNLRQILADQSKEEGWKCRCIRCREVKENYNPKEKIYLFRQDYEASDGKEIFLSFENKNRTKLYSLLRLRTPNDAISSDRTLSRQKVYLFSALKDAAIIREIHTYGQLHPLKQSVGEPFSDNSPQHKGLGKKLIKEAEKIAKKEFGLNKISAISGIGVRSYFKKLGYRLENTYMVKNI